MKYIIAAIALILTASYGVYTVTSPNESMIGGVGGDGTIYQLQLWKKQGDYITQNASGTPLKLTNYGSSGDCLVTDAQGVVSTSSCGGVGSGITSLNGLTNTTQTFAVGTSSNVGIHVVSSGSTHTFTPTVASGYSIPLTASSSEWNSFYTTPSSRITAGTNLSWSGNTLNATGGTGSITTSTTPTPGHLPYWTSTSALGSIATGSLTETVTGLQFDQTRGLVGGSAVLSLSSGFTIPSTTDITGWNLASSSRHSAVTLSGALDYITLVGQDIVRGAIDLATDVTGFLGISNGGTGTSTAPLQDRILVGNGTGYDYRRITAGSNVTVSTSTPGQIIISSTASGGTTTAGIQVPSWIVDASGDGDFTTIQGALDACTSGGTIFINDAYTYVGATGLRFKGSRCHIYGRNSSTTLEFAGATTAFKSNSAAAQYAYNGIHDLVLVGDGTAGSIAIDASDMINATYENILVDNFDTFVRLDDTQDITFYNTFENFKATTIGSFGINASSTRPTNSNRFINGFVGCTADCIGAQFNNSNGNLMQTMRFENASASTTGIFIFDYPNTGTNDGVFANRFEDLYIEGNTRGIVVASSTNNGGGIKRNIFSGMVEGNTTDLQLGTNVVNQNTFLNITDSSFGNPITSFQRFFGIATTSPVEEFAVSGDAYVSATTTTGGLKIAALTGFLKATAGNVATALVDLASDITGVLADDNGGTGQSTYSTGDMLYASGANTLAKRTIGSTGNVLMVSGGVPTWVATSSLGISGGSGTVYLATTSPWTNGNVAYVTGAGTVGSVATGTLTETVSGLELSATRALVGGSAVLALTSGFTIPTTTDLTNWNNAFSFYTTPSTRITAGTNLSWSGNTLNAGTQISTSSTPGNLAFWTGTSALGNVATGTLSETVNGLQFDQTRALVGGSAILSLTSGFTIPSTTDITNWNNAFSWGNHASAGYLTSASIDTSSELRAILGDEAGSGPAVFASSTSLTSPTLFNFFGTPCSAGEFLTDIADNGAFTCTAGGGGGGGGSLSTSTDIIGAPGTVESLSYVSDDFLIGGSSSSTAEFQFDPDGGQLFIASTSNTNATATVESTNNAQAVRIGDDSGVGIEWIFSTVGKAIAHAYGGITETIFQSSGGTTTLSIGIATTTPQHSSLNPGILQQTLAQIAIGLDRAVGYLKSGRFFGSLTVNGLIFQENWAQVDCSRLSGAVSVAADGFTSCDGFMFYEDGTATLNAGGSNGVAWDSIVSAASNDGAGVFVSAPSGGFLTMATNTPVMEATVALNNTTVWGTTTRAYIGFTNISAGGSTYETAPTAGCYFTASTSIANWYAVCQTSATAQTRVDTGIASTTSTTTNPPPRRFLIEAGKDGVSFFMQTSESNSLSNVANIATNVPTTTSLNAGIHFGKSVNTNSVGLDIYDINVGWRKFIK